jgi:predicted neuraminidase
MVEQDASGRLHMGWFSGSSEGQDGVAIVYAQLNSTTAAAPAVWSAADVISQRKGYSNQNAVLHAEADTLHAFHSQQGGGAGESKATVWHLSAPLDKEGQTGAFSMPVEVFSEPGSFDKNRVVPRLDGSWLLPIYEQGVKPNEPRNKFLPKGADPDDAKQWTDGKYKDGDNLVQPSVVRPKPGSPDLVAFFRDRKARNVYSASSSDDGASWSASKPTTLLNNNAGAQRASNSQSPDPAPAR